jgi:hypothetical protein
MMNFTDLAKRAERLVANNSPAILTAIGVTGTLTTALLASQASFKAARILGDLEYELEIMNQPPADFKTKVANIWILYLPSVATGGFTVACIIGANRIGTRRAAAMAAAYSLSEKAFVEYKDKVVERIGEGKEQKIRDEIAQDRVNANPVTSREVILTGSGDVLCYDSITGRYFQSSMETLRKAENDVNKQILHDGYASLHEFYSAIGLEATPYSSEIGWNSDTLLELRFSAVLSDDKRPCISIEYHSYPIRNYTQF